MHYEFSTPSMETAVSLEAQLDQLMQTMHETYEIENLFQDPKMELAVSLFKAGQLAHRSCRSDKLRSFIDHPLFWIPSSPGVQKTGSSYSSFVRCCSNGGVLWFCDKRFSDWCFCCLLWKPDCTFWT